MVFLLLLLFFFLVACFLSLLVWLPGHIDWVEDNDDAFSIIIGI